MPQIIFTKLSDRKTKVEVSGDEGEIEVQFIVDRFNPKQVQLFADLAGTDATETLTLINQIFDNTKEDEPFPADFEYPSDYKEIVDRIKGADKKKKKDTKVEPSIETNRTFVIHVRDITQSKQFATAFSGENVETVLREAFLAPLSNETLKEPLLEWNDLNTLCCLDIDYHNVEGGVTSDYIDKLLSRIVPKPLLYHTSHGNGAKLYYLSSPGYTAREIASIAGLSWITIDGRATFDLIGSTRHPCYGRTRDNKPAPVLSYESIPFLYGQADLSTVRKMLCQDVEFNDVASFLSEQGLSIGTVLPHSKCPIQPTDDQKENVLVGDRGFYCHRCAARGYTLGGMAGFVSYATLIGSTDNRVTTMVKNFCHLEHASIVLSNIYPNVPEKVLADVYRTMLKIVHTPEDPRIPLAMMSGKGFVRTRGMWVSADGSESLKNGQIDFVRSLPAVKYIKKGNDDEPGKLAPDVSKVVAFSNAGDLEEYGYNDVSFIRGTKIYGQFLKYRDSEIIKVVNRKEFKNRQPEYIAKHKRMPSEEAWGFLEGEFKGIDRNYVKLLIASKGASEGRLAQCPFLLVCGVSGAGKSTTVHIAAGICGDKADEPIFVPYPDRFRMSLMDAARSSGFVCINEIFKSAKDAKLSAVSALNPMLSLTEDSRSHVLYVGSVPFGRLPVFVLTDITIPSEVEGDMQLARRFVFYRLPNQNNWQDNLISRGIRPHEFRLISPDHSAAANAILSEVIDDFFQEPIPLYKIAQSLQAGTLDTYSGERELTLDVMKQFYQATVDAPKLTGAMHTNRYKPHLGWKLIDRATDTKITQLWNELCDGREPADWVRSRVVDSQDWKKVLGLNINIVCETKYAKNQNYVYVRFRSTESNHSPGWINGELN